MWNSNIQLIGGDKKTVTGDKSVLQEFSLAEGTKIEWTASANYFTSQSGTYTVTSNNDKKVTLALKSASEGDTLSPSGTSGSGVSDLADGNKPTKDFKLTKYAELGKNETIYYTFNSNLNDNALITSVYIQYIVCYGLPGPKVNIGLYLNGNSIASSDGISADYLTTSYNKRKNWTVNLIGKDVKASDIKNGNLKFGITCTTRGCNVFGADLKPNYINPN